jgi:hypothetical protein
MPAFAGVSGWHGTYTVQQKEVAVLIDLILF